MSRFTDISLYLTQDDLCSIGTWTLCTSLRYSLIPSLKGGRAPDPRKILLLADEDNILIDTEKLKMVTERRLETDGIDPEVLEAYVRQIPAENIYWLDKMHKDRLDLVMPMDGQRLMLKNNFRETYYAYLQYQWLFEHRDGSRAFARYLSRLALVVDAYMVSENSGPAWGSRSGFQWDPLREIPPFVMAEQGTLRWIDPHPLQISRAALFEEE